MDRLVIDIAVLVLAGFVGFAVISKVPNTLHTPLMSGTNAIHGIVVLGGLLLMSEANGVLEKVVLVMDNLNIHRRKSLTDLLGEDLGNEVWSRFTIHYTPTHGSWLNQAEIEIGILSRQCLGTRRIPDLKTLTSEVRAWNRHMNRFRTRINWRFDRKAARRRFGYKRKPFKRSST